MMPFEWNFSTPPYDLGELPTLTKEILSVFRDGFGLDGWSSEGVEKVIVRSSALGLLRDQQGRTCGYAIYTLPNELLVGSYFLWEESVCLNRDAQGLGLSMRAIHAVQGIFSDRRVEWLGGRTQNPVVMHRYSQLGPTFPFANSYAVCDGPSVVEFLVRNISGVRDQQNFDRESGICVGAYKRVLGDYPWRANGTFEEWLTARGFDRSRGDAVVVVSMLRAPGRTTTSQR